MDSKEFGKNVDRGEVVIERTRFGGSCVIVKAETEPGQGEAQPAKVKTEPGVVNDGGPYQGTLLRS